MANVFDSQKRMVTLSDGSELQEWNVERLADGSFEYHSYVGHNYNQGRKRLSAGAIWMIIRLTNPGGVNEITEYAMGRTGLPGSGNDTLQDAWDNRATISYYRYDQILQTFFNG